MKKINITLTLIMLLSVCFTGGIKAQAIKSDRSLWGFWYLESIEQSTSNGIQLANVQKTSMDVLLKTKKMPISNIFTAIHFFEDNTMGLCSLTDPEEMKDFIPLSINTKGSYKLKDNYLTIKVAEEEPYDVEFTYKVINNTLEITSRNAGNNNNGGYKLVFIKTEE